MAYDQDIILGTFIRIARTAVGDSLSKIGKNKDIPAVFKQRQDGVVESYPYILIDVLNTTKTDGWQLSEGVNELEQYVIDTSYKLLLQYTVYGGNATQIAHNLEQYLRLEPVLDKISAETTGQLEETYDVIALPTRLETQNLEVAAFNLTFNIVDRFTDVDGIVGTFNTISTTGELYRDTADDAPLPIKQLDTSL